MSRTLRYLRIAFSALWGLTAVLLVVLWVRSYYRLDEVHCRGNAFGSRVFWSAKGEFTTYFRQDVRYTTNGHHSYPASEAGKPPSWRRAALGFTVYKNDSSKYVFAMRHWTAVVLVGASAALPWLPWKGRFSLRTLLIGMTVLAAVLGLVVWAMR
jgi:hypothetical protein